MSGDGMRHPTDALAEYAAGVLDPSERTTIETHLTACSSCRAATAVQPSRAAQHFTAR